MTEILAYHPDSQNLALLCSGAELWIGQYDPSLTHQNGEPMYVFIFSCSSVDSGLHHLFHLDPKKWY